MYNEANKEYLSFFFPFMEWEKFPGCEICETVPQLIEWELLEDSKTMED